MIINNNYEDCNVNGIVSYNTELSLGDLQSRKKVDLYDQIAATNHSTTHFYTNTIFQT